MDPFSTQNATIPVVAKTNVTKVGDIKVYVNRRLITFRLNRITGEILFNASLIPGSNTINVKVENHYGEAEDNTIVIFKKEKQGYHQQLPLQNLFLIPMLVNKNVTVLATIKHVINASNIEMKFNNNPTTNFVFNSVTKKLEVNLNLKDGRNKIYIKATNSYGNSDDEVVINIKILPCCLLQSYLRLS